MNNISIANQTIKITTNGFYLLDGQKIKLLPLDFAEVKVISPGYGRTLADSYAAMSKTGQMCSFKVTNEDSFKAASRYDKPLVMNFANAFQPGGGFRLGANAQEEALCRCSTLYASLRSADATVMYRYNLWHFSRVASDYMLISPQVCVFRDEHCQLLTQPFQVGVVTVPAPNRRGAAFFASKSLIAETMTRRIRILLAVAADKGYKTLILGAWGCGAFGNSADDVSGYFRKVLVEEEFGRLFDEVCFAVYGKTEGKNILAFKKSFA